MTNAQVIFYPEYPSGSGKNLDISCTVHGLMKFGAIIYDATSIKIMTKKSVFTWGCTEIPKF